MSALLQLRLSVDYASNKDVLRDVALEINEGEILGLAGESGSGKSTIALSILGLLEHKRGIAKGQILFGGRDLLQLRPKEMRKVRGREIALVLQSPLASLNPALKIGTQMAEAWRAHSSDVKAWKYHAIEAFDLVHLPDPGVFLNRYPREVSVGQAQRILIAMAILHRPRLLIADEATSALDAITQSEILQLFKRLNRELNMAVLFISHDLLSVASLCDRVAVLHAGTIVECGTTGQIFSNPREAYTRRLLNALPHGPLKVAEDLQALAEQLGSKPVEATQPVA
jgi:ABC-type dipeptide/oligopeptide/nickel transport system ATPase component